MLAAAILAAGESRRMGSPKSLQTIHGKTFVQHLLDAVCHPRIRLTQIILGSGAEEIRAQIHADNVSIVVNEEWPKGQLSSIRAAIRSLPANRTEGLILCPVDHPLVSQRLLAQLIDKFDRSGKRIVIPTHKGRRGHPVIFGESLFEELLAASDEIGARQVVHAHPEEIAEVATDEEGVVLNLNDSESLRRASLSGNF